MVAGNVKAQGIQLIREHGPYSLKGEPGIRAEMEELLKGIVAQRRMKLGS